MALRLLGGRLQLNTCKGARWCEEVPVETSFKDCRVAYIWVNSLVWAIVVDVEVLLERSSKDFRTSHMCGGGRGGGAKDPRREGL